MAEAQELNLKMENIHKSVKIKTKPSKKQPLATKKPKPKEQTKKIEKAKGPVKKTQEVSPQSKDPASLTSSPEKKPDPEPVPEPQIIPDAVEEVKKEEKEATLPENIDPTLHRKHKVKDTFSAVFPAYGLWKPKEEFKSENQRMSKDLNEAEPIDWSYHNKMDAMKRYTEEMLKAANMRGAKK